MDYIYIFCWTWWGPFRPKHVVQNNRINYLFNWIYFNSNLTSNPQNLRNWWESLYSSGPTMHLSGAYILFFLMPKPIPMIFIFRHFEGIGLACIAEMTSLYCELGYGFMIYLTYKLHLNKTKTWMSLIHGRLITWSKCTRKRKLHWWLLS